MTYEDIEKLLIELRIAPLEEGEFEPFDETLWDEIGIQNEAHVPDVLRWFHSRFGGCHFPEGAFYHDPRSHHVHDAPADVRLDVIDDSIEHFLRSLRGAS